jgi:2-methylisocitrate lyase-like PEP mutase family enzyme
LPDGAVKRDDMLAHIKELVDATNIPVNADFENGYADDPDDVAESVRLCLATGVAGLSIEDAIEASAPTRLARARGRESLNPGGVGAASQRLIPTGKQLSPQKKIPSRCPALY